MDWGLVVCDQLAVGQGRQGKKNKFRGFPSGPKQSRLSKFCFCCLKKHVLRKGSVGDLEKIQLVRDSGADHLLSLYEI